MPTKTRSGKKRELLQAICNTDEGIELLEYLKKEYLLQSSIKEDTHMTYYELGRRDLVCELLNLKESDNG